MRKHSFAKQWLGGLAAVLLTAVIPASAHHAFVMFDQKAEVVLTGAVTEFQWTNPHTWIELDVVDASGGKKHWSIETGSLGVLARQGWNSTIIKPGDRISVLVHPLRSGEPGGSLVGVIFANGGTHGKAFAPP